MEAAETRDRKHKKAAAELLVLTLLDEQDRHGYDLAKQIERRSGGVLSFRVASIYTLLNRLETHGWIAGRWVEKAGTRRRRFYRLTDSGKRALSDQRHDWLRFIEAVAKVTRLSHA